MTLKTLIKWIGIGILSLSLQGFGWFYQPEIRQGNIMTDKQIAQLREGMTFDEVRKLLGTPVLEQVEEDELDLNGQTPSIDVNEGDERDIMKVKYVYLFEPNYGSASRKRINLAFEDSKLIELTILN